MRILNESKRDDLLLPYLEILNNKGIKCTLGELKRFLLRYFVEKGGFRNLSLGSNFYLAGVARYYFNGDLTLNKDLNVFSDDPMNGADTWNDSVCERLNALILVLRNSIVDSVGSKFEQPEDFGELSLPKLLRKYGKKIDEVLGIVSTKKKKNSGEELDRNDNVGNNYTFDILYSYDDARKYNKATEPGAWCITYGQNHYNYYARNLGIHYVIFKKEGYENILRQKGAEWTKQKPQDEYGCSLIALLQSNTNGEPVYITSRWNHGCGWEGTSCEADHAFTKFEFMEKTGVTDADLQRIFTIWQKDKNKRTSIDRSAEKIEKLRALRYLKYAQMRINGGENPDTALIEIPHHIESSEDKKAYIEGSKYVYAGNGKPTKSFIAYRITIEGEKYAVLVDQGKILFETLIPIDLVQSGGWRTTYMFLNSEGKYKTPYSQYEFNGLKNIVLVRLPNEKYMIYNLRLHQFLEIDGVKVFKYMDNMSSSWYRAESGIRDIFYEIKMSNNQVALVDINTNVPLKLPNGQHWCERISYDNQREYWSRGVKPMLINNNNHHICMTYDSSANEAYVYDVRNKIFTKLDVSDVPQTAIFSVRMGNLSGVEEIFGEGAFSVMIGPAYSSQQIVYKDNKRLGLGNMDKFRSIYPLYGNDFYQVTFYDVNERKHKTTIYSTRYKSFILNEHGALLTFTESFSNADKEIEDVYFLQVDSGNGEYRDNSRYIYRVLIKNLGVILQNPDNNSENFCIGYEGRWYTSKIRGEENAHEQYNIKCVIIDSEGRTHGEKVYNAKELIKQGYYREAFLPDSATVCEVEKSSNTDRGLNEENILENITIDDIKIMVNEIINKLTL